MSELVEKFLKKAASASGANDVRHWLNCAALSCSSPWNAYALSWMALHAVRPAIFGCSPCCCWNDSEDDDKADFYYGALPSRIFTHIASGAYKVIYENGAKAYYALADAVSYCMITEEATQAIDHYNKISAEYEGQDLTVGL